MGIASFSGASSVIKPGVVTSSTRPSSPFVGQLIYETDTNRLAAYNGSAWVTQNSLQYITGATFSAVTSVSLPANTFSATYTNYLVQFYATADGAEALMTARFRASGSDNTTSNYSYAGQARYSNSNDASVEGNAVSSFGMRGIFTGLPGSQVLTICEPQTANKTTVSGMIIGNSASGAALVTSIAFSGIFNATTSFDSYSFLASTAITGKYKVYGYSNS